MVNVGLIVALHAKAYVETSQKSTMEFLEKIVPLWIFERVLNTLAPPR